MTETSVCVGKAEIFFHILYLDYGRANQTIAGCHSLVNVWETLYTLNPHPYPPRQLSQFTHSTYVSIHIYIYTHHTHPYLQYMHLCILHLFFAWAHTSKLKNIRILDLGKQKHYQKFGGMTFVMVDQLYILTNFLQRYQLGVSIKCDPLRHVLQIISIHSFIVGFSFLSHFLVRILKFKYILFLRAASWTLWPSFQNRATEGQPQKI